MVSAQLEGPLLEQYEDAEEDEDGGNKSEFLRSVLRDGLRARNISTYEQAGLSRRISGQLEDERPVGDTQEDILREVIEDGLEARRGDVLDTLGASDELRERVEAAREEGEPAEDALRRLIRQGIEAQERDLFDAIGAGEKLKVRVMERAEDDEEPDDTVRRLLLEGTRRTSPVQESTRAAGGSAVILILFALVFGSLPSAILQTSLLGLTTVNTLTTGVGGVLVLAWIFFMAQLVWRVAKERFGG